MKEELVSIIMPAYNAENYIEESINSVLEQTYENYELIIVNDCSTDSTAEIISNYSIETNKIISVNNEINLGVAETRNKAISLASGKYIAFLDSDDIWHPDKLAKQIKFMSNNSVEFSYTNYEVVDKNTKSLGKVVVVPSSMTYSDLLKGSKIGCLTVVYDTTKILWPKMKNIGHEDYLAWLEILKQIEKGSGIKETLAYYRETSQSLSGNKFKAMQWQYSIYRNELSLSRLKSAYYFCMYAINGITKYKGKR